MTHTAPELAEVACPQCGLAGALPLVYGYPDPQQIRAAMRGEIALGGVVNELDPPRYECRSDDCGYTFGS